MGDKSRFFRTSREPTHLEADSLTFGLYGAEEVRKLSTVAITSPVSFNQLGHPVEGGLYDLRMGPANDRSAYYRPGRYIVNDASF